jgi:glycerol-3-phosphate acyltransferase PlsY
MTILAIAAGYLLGSIPFAFLLARRGGVDLRQSGSRNVGASNVLRTRGVRAAVAALGLDGAKGSAAVLLAQIVSGQQGAAAMAAGVASIVGHIYPPWLNFRGGKGVATAAGVFLVLAPAATAAAAAVFLVVVWLTRYISAGSLAAAVTLVAGAFLGGLPRAIVTGASLAAVIIVHRHRENLRRLIAGTERRIGQRLL